MVTVEQKNKVVVTLDLEDAEALERLLRSEKWSKLDENRLNDIHNALADSGVDGGVDD